MEVKNKIFLILLATLTILLFSANIAMAATDCTGALTLSTNTSSCCGLAGNTCGGTNDYLCCKGTFCNSNHVCEEYNPTPDDCKYSALARGETCGAAGAHCGSAGDATHSPDPACCTGYNCYYNMCLAQVGLTCANGHDCSGDCGISGCRNNKCCGTSMYPCTSDSACCDGYYCSSKNYCALKEYCGDGAVTGTEQCELPGTTDNKHCCQTNTTCDGAKFGVRDLFGNCDASCGCVEDSFNYACVVGQCGATCAGNSDCAPKCVGNVYNYGGTCDTTTSCACSYSSQNCDLQDGWYNTTTTQWINNTVCTEKEQKQQKYRDYSCSLPSGCTYTENNSRWIDTGNTRNKANGTSCNDGLFCTNPDVCTSGVCSGTTRVCSDGLYCTTDSCNEVSDQCVYTPRSCSAFNISQIATCDNNPDNYHYTWDFRAWFTSTCSELTQNCTSGNSSISHTCDVADCNAGCDATHSCANNSCSATYNDSCSGYKLVEYNNNKIKDSTTVSNTCSNSCNLGTCFCSNCSVTCSPPTTNTYCVAGVCGAVCDSNDDCDDGNIHTTDTCLGNCTCQHITNPYCGDGFVNITAGETCELPSTSNNAYCPQNTTQCLGTKLGTRDGLGDCNNACGCGYDEFQYSCVKGSCGATCNSNADCADKCIGDVRYSSGNCDSGNTCSCSYSTENCSSHDGWVDTANIRWVNDTICTEKEQKQQEYKDFMCAPGGCTFIVSDYRWVDTGNTRNKSDGTSCNDGLFCTNPDVCTAGICGGPSRVCADSLYCTIDSCNELTDQCTYTPRDCSAFNISQIATCDNNPDSYHYTFDFRTGFISTCSEQTQNCTVGNDNITHTCDKAQCGAECSQDSDCNDNNIHTADTCLGNCTCVHTPIPYCGDGIVQAGEQCDDGANNGIGRCNLDCTFKIPYCYDINLTLNRSHLDNYCGQNPGLDVTFNATYSDDIYARQYACTGEKASAYIYLDWYNIQKVNLTNATAFIEQKGYNYYTWLEYFDGISWNYVRDLPTVNSDTLNSCLVSLNKDLENISLRVGIDGIYTGGFEDLDWGYINLGYCENLPIVLTSTVQSSSSSGGSHHSSGGGGSGGSLTTNDWTCGAWSSCVNGKQTQKCTEGIATKTNTQDCTVAPTTTLTTQSTTLPSSQSPTTQTQEATGTVQTFGLNTGASTTGAQANEPVKTNDITGLMAGISTAVAGISINWYAIVILLLIIGCLPLFFHFVGKK